MRKYNYDLNRTLEQIQPNYFHIEIYLESVPEAIIAYLEASDFESAVRNAVSLGDDGILKQLLPARLLKENIKFCNILLIYACLV